MLRKDRVFITLKMLCDNIPRDYNMSGDNGFTAQEIADAAGISRANASADLNALVREKKIIKIPGKPVKFLDDRWSFNGEGKIIFSYDTPENANIVHDSVNLRLDPFTSLVGYEGSLKNVCEQAKAAMLYPPHGLHTLIIGESGTGKTLIANLMYRFALYSGKLDYDSPFITLNCSDYYHNPQLLVSLLFGYERGSFTGADSSKEGLVRQAEGGILFLDEIHRLPPEGQEMLFSLMDRGIYRKIGGNKEEHISDVLIIGATTEDPYSALLSTFMRRIPMVIKVPPLNERPVSEKIQLIKNMLIAEANKLNVPINMKPSVVRTLLTSIQYGNIGQLKSIIQYACAKAFLNYTIAKGKYLNITIDCLPEGYRTASQMKEKDDDGIYLTPSKGGNGASVRNGQAAGSDWYKKLSDDINNMVKAGYTEDQAIIALSEKLNNNFKGISDNLFKSQRERLLSIVPPQVLTYVERLIDILRSESDIKITQRLNGIMTLYIGQMYQRLESRESYDTQIKFEADITQADKLLAKKLIDELIKMTGKNIPEIEINLLASLIHSLTLEQLNDTKVKIIVLAHGKDSATSISNVVNTIFGEEIVYGFNLLLNENIADFFNRILKACLRIDNGAGILFMVDMGSLMDFGDRISGITGIRTATIGSVSTPKVLEAVSKSFLSDDLEEIAMNVIESDKLYYANIKGLNDVKQEKAEPINLDISITLPSLLSYYLDFLNPDEVASKLSESLETLQRNLNIDLKDNAVLIFIAHLARLLERMLIGGQNLTSVGDLSIKDNHKKLYLGVKSSLASIEDFYNIEIPDSEICFLTEIVLMNS